MCIRIFISDENHSPFIRGISIIFNFFGVLLYLALVLSVSEVEDLHSLSLRNLWLYLAACGLAPLAITTYFLWYLKKSNENIIGIFIVAPVAIFTHYVFMGIAAHAEFLGKNTDVLITMAELFLTIGFILILQCKGYTR
jgi:hypothetical protein